MQPEFNTQGLSITAELCEAHAKVDRAAMKRILTNILDNSVKYRTGEQGSLHFVLTDEDEMYQLALIDDGPGVKTKSLAKLFDLFYRESNSRQNPQRGSGLGLAIVAKIIERMGGTIRAENADPHGLSVIIRLPKEN